MRIIKININNPNPKTIQEAAKVILDSGSVVIPTDTAYGLAVNALDRKAVLKLVKLKRRPKGKPFPLAIKNIEQGKKLAYFNKKALILARKFWPGALTLVLDKKELVPGILCSDQDKIGLRIPDSPVCKMLARILEFPYTITSANVSRQKTPYEAKEVVSQFLNQREKPDLILDGGRLLSRKPSTVVEVSGEKIKVLREGDIASKEIFNLQFSNNDQLLNFQLKIH